MNIMSVLLIPNDQADGTVALARREFDNDTVPTTDRPYSCQSCDELA